MKLVLVFIGGGVGSVLRYSMGLLVGKLTPTDTEPPHWLSMYPASTLMVNVIGCLLIGIAWGVLGDPKESDGLMQTALIVGLLGGFTTFSSFGWETISLMNNGRVGSAMAYVLVSVGVGLLAAWGGHAIGLMISGTH